MLGKRHGVLYHAPIREGNQGKEEKDKIKFFQIFDLKRATCSIREGHRQDTPQIASS